MGTNYEATNVSSGVMQQATLNQELQNLQVAVERALSIYGDNTNGVNDMQAALDMNSNNILNGGQGDFDALTINGQLVFPGPHSGLGIPVDLTGIQDGDTLVWDAAQSIFIPASQAVTPPFGCLNTMSYTGQSLDVSTIFAADAVFVRPGGADIYIADSGGFPVTIDRYTMSTAFDLGTATLTSSQDYASAQSIRGIGFNSAGTRIYLTDEAAFGDEAVRQFDLSSAWDSTTPGSPVVFVIGPSVFDGKTLDDGSTFYVLEVGSMLTEYNMPTPEDITGMTLTNTFDVAAATGSGEAQGFWVQGTSLYVLMLNSAGGDEIYQFDLGAAGSLAAPTLTGGTGLPFDVSTQNGTPRSLAADPTLENFYMLGGDEVVYRYTTTAQASCP